MSSTKFVLAKVSKNDIIFVGEDESEETRSLREAKVFNEEETDFSFIPVTTAEKIVKRLMSRNT